MNQNLPVRPSHQRCGDWKRIESSIPFTFVMEVAKAVQAIARLKAWNTQLILFQIKAWFSAIVNWIFQHPTANRRAGSNGNNHSGLLGRMQAAVFAETCWKWRSASLLAEMYKRPTPPRSNGCWCSIPFGIGPNKALMVIHFLTLECNDHDLSSAFLRRRRIYLNSNLKTEEAIGLGISFLKFVCKRQIELWTFPKDVMSLEEWPVRHPFLLFGGLGIGREWILWT